MAGYSNTPLAKKLGLREGHRFAFVGAPDTFPNSIGPLPDGARVVGGRGIVDVAVLFVRSRAELEKHFARLAGRLDPKGGLWIAWPKRASGISTDVTEGVVREVGLSNGLVDNKVCAIDDVWSGLRFVVRLVDRPKR